jgi:Beta-lactamase superfamily domain
VNVTLYGVRGSLATPGPSTARYGGNTSCVRLTGPDGHVMILDAGTGIRSLAQELPRELTRVDVLLTHLHMDHILGLGFFGPLYDPRMEVHIWGPASATLSLEARLRRYLSPPLFPVMLRSLPCQLELHHVVRGPVPIGPFLVTAARVCHPGPTVGYRVETRTASLAYLPDHEPALGARRFPLDPDWTSGSDLRGRPAAPRRAVHARGVSEPRRLGAQYDPRRTDPCSAWEREAFRTVPPRPRTGRRCPGSRDRGRRQGDASRLPGDAGCRGRSLRSGLGSLS